MNSAVEMCNRGKEVTHGLNIVAQAFYEDAEGVRIEGLDFEGCLLCAKSN